MFLRTLEKSPILSLSSFPGDMGKNVPSACGTTEQDCDRSREMPWEEMEGGGLPQGTKHYSYNQIHLCKLVTYFEWFLRRRAVWIGVSKHRQRWTLGLPLWTGTTRTGSLWGGRRSSHPQLSKGTIVHSDCVCELLWYIYLERSSLEQCWVVRAVKMGTDGSGTHNTTMGAGTIQLWLKEYERIANFQVHMHMHSKASTMLLAVQNPTKWDSGSYIVH